jgi:hypothetical protein
MKDKIEILLHVYEPKDLLDTISQNPSAHLPHSIFAEHVGLGSLRFFAW